MKRISFISIMASYLAFNLHAQSIVTNTADSGLGTLRSALASAVNGETITFAGNLSGATITLASALPINTSLTINASALPGGIQINGSDAFSVFNVASGVTGVLNSLTITNGNSSGGGIYNNNGTVILTGCTLSGNSSGFEGGGILNYEGTATLTGCTLSGNSAEYGSCIFNYNGTMTLTGCTLSGNGEFGTSFGGAIGNQGTMTLNQCTLSGNIATNNSTGAIVNYDTLTLNGCTLSGNIAGANDAQGGGINNSGTATLNECTLSGNSAPNNGFGGGINNNSGTVTLNQCTLSGNSASVEGGGILNEYGTVVLDQCTLLSNNVFGIECINANLLAITNSILAANNGADVFCDDTPLIYGGSNLVVSTTGAYSGPAPLTAAPGLAPLGNYGGPTQTIPPLPGSPAIGAGSLAVNSFTNDQRGYARTQNGLIDLGAVELPTVQPFTATPTVGITPLTVKFQSASADSDASAIVRWSWSFGNGAVGTVQNPTNVYNTIGLFAPALIVTNNLGLAMAVSGPTIFASVYSSLPAISGISLSKTNVMLKGTNGVSTLMYSVLTSTNLLLPVSQWSPLTTNTWSANGAFNLTLTNALNPPVPKRFYLLRVP